MKYLVVSSSGSTTKMADFSLQNFSASTAVSKQRICSISLSRKALSRERTVERTEAIACSAVLRAEPANHLALWLGGSLSSRSWNWFFPLTLEGARSSCTSLNTDTMCRFSTGLPSSSSVGRYSATSRNMAVKSPSALS